MIERLVLVWHYLKALEFEWRILRALERLVVYFKDLSSMRARASAADDVKTTWAFLKPLNLI